MSLRTKLTWAFILVAAAALTLAFVGLNGGMFASMIGPSHWGAMPFMMAPGHMPGLLAPVLRWSLLSSVVALTLAGAFGYWTAGRITRPLLALRDATQHLGLRDLTRRLPIEGDDEIADVARAFNRMGDRLEAEERTRRQLFADVAHELRHPLAVMKGRLEMMQDGVVPVDPESLLPLQDEVIRLGRLIGDLRDLSLAEVGGLSLHLSQTDLAALAEGVLTDLQPVAAAKEIALSAEVPATLPTLEADPDRLRQVLINLLANAIQYTPEGGRVTLEATPVGRGVEMRVSDTGPGISEADLPHIFDRFYRADKSRTRRTGGSGLGLAIVRSLIELHHGRIQVQSQEGQGTCFIVWLPLSQP